MKSSSTHGHYKQENVSSVSSFKSKSLEYAKVDSKAKSRAKALFERTPFRRSGGRKTMPVRSHWPGYKEEQHKTDFKGRPLPPVPTNQNEFEMSIRERSKSLNMPRSRKGFDFFDVSIPTSSHRHHMLASGERKISHDFHKMANMTTSNSHEMLNFASFDSSKDLSLSEFKKHFAGRSRPEKNTGSNKQISRSRSYENNAIADRANSCSVLRRSRSMDFFNELSRQMRGFDGCVRREPYDLLDSSRSAYLQFQCQNMPADTNHQVFVKLTENPGYKKFANQDEVSAFNALPHSMYSSIDETNVVHSNLIRDESMYAQIPDIPPSANEVLVKPKVKPVKPPRTRIIPRRPNDSAAPLPQIPGQVYPHEFQAPFSSHWGRPPSREHIYSRASAVEHDYSVVGNHNYALVGENFLSGRKLDDRMPSFRSSYSGDSGRYAKIPDIMPETPKYDVPSPNQLDTRVR